jgi:outer membrane protein
MQKPIGTNNQKAFKNNYNHNKLLTVNNNCVAATKTKNLRTMKKVLTLMILACGLLVANRTQAQNKFGYINVQEVIAAMPETKKADSALREFQAALYNNAKDKETALNEDIQKMSGADTLKMTSAQREIKRQDLQKRYQELTQESQSINETLQKKQEELITPIQKKAIDAIQAVAKENAYTYVFLKDALIVSPPADDIFPLVKKKLAIK